MIIFYKISFIFKFFLKSKNLFFHYFFIKKWHILRTLGGVAWNFFKKNKKK